MRAKEPARNGTADDERGKQQGKNWGGENNGERKLGKREEKSAARGAPRESNRQTDRHSAKIRRQRQNNRPQQQQQQIEEQQQNQQNEEAVDDEEQQQRAEREAAEAAAEVGHGAETAAAEPHGEAAEQRSSPGGDFRRYLSPPRKIRRMHGGVITSGSGGASASVAATKSVGQRIKNATLKQEHGGGAAAVANGTSYGGGARGVRGTPQQLSALHACQTTQFLRQHQSVALTELQKNTVRIIGQYLRELGMMETVDSLVEESGCRIENPLSQKLRDFVQMAEWQKALGIVEKLRAQLSQRQYVTVRVLLLEERFKELIERGEFLLALRLLQLDFPKCKELLPRHEHWATVLCSRDIGPNAPREGAETGGSAQNVLSTLRKVLPPSLMLPPNRLQELMKQSWMYQTKQCDLHVLPREQNVLDERSILVDHQCTSHEFPSKNTSTLYLHNAEVWCVKFSPCGNYLASGVKGNQVLIWRVISPTQVHIHQNIHILQEIVGISSLSWSQDSRYLAVTSTEQANGVGCFIYFVPSGRLVKEYVHYTGDAFTTVAFFKDGSHKLACAGEKGHFHVYDIHRPEDSAKMFEGFRIRCLYACMDGKTVLAADTHNRIRAYDFETMHEQTLIQEASQIITFCVDRKEKYCLVTTKTEGIRLWDLRTNDLVRSFFGSKHNEFVITSSFGGPDELFIASGSEDNTVVIWNTRRTHPVKRLIGHTSTVNAVSWNPVDNSMVASGSDDGTIKIWSCGTSF
ncbi:hypothetical protein niasHS_005917 [Heterodera schachtii]|uniref:WD repeat-containing protein 26 n=1 Tax=Heterodera schachtii TaxID=97005 RepID=A0ABD2JS47_HETSC